MTSLSATLTFRQRNLALTQLEGRSLLKAAALSKIWQFFRLLAASWNEKLNRSSSFSNGTPSTSHFRSLDFHTSGLNTTKRTLTRSFLAFERRRSSSQTNFLCVRKLWSSWQL